MKLNLFILFCAVFAISSCKKSGNVPPNLTQKPDVYIVGYDHTNAVYWKNGKEALLTKTYSAGTFFSAMATAITISNNNDVFIVGEGTHENGIKTALIWKNGVLDTLQSLTEYDSVHYPVTTTAWSVAISGSDIYVGGQQYGDVLLNTGAILWKNGIPTGYGPGYEGLSSIALANGHSYSTGPNTGQPNNLPNYYVDGSIRELPANSYALTWDMAVAGNDIYVVGQDDHAPVYWKNGSEDTLHAPFPYAEANSIALSGNDVYIGGNNDETLGGGLLWKNGQLMVTPALSGFSDKWRKIAVYGTDIYDVGYKDTVLTTGSQSIPVAIFWKNGAAKPIPLAGPYSNAISIYIP
jgi:hypothetical protein